MQDLSSASEDFIDKINMEGVELLRKMKTHRYSSVPVSLPEIFMIR